MPSATLAATVIKCFFMPFSLRLLSVRSEIAK
jgi:hypothetical protein